jgi:hypothetical protein
MPTIAPDRPTFSAMVLLLMPSAAIKTMRARRTIPAGSVRDRE